MAKLINLLGMKFNRLTVVAKDQNHKDPVLGLAKQRAKWVCKCDCGNYVSVFSDNLRRGVSKSCGCLLKDYYKNKPKQKKVSPQHSKTNAIYCNYITRANLKGLEFQLSFEEFKGLINQNCFYCGTLPSQKVRTDSLNFFRMNGIDRKDSNIGYIKENCVTCCKTCNYGKRDLSYDVWISYLDSLVKFRANEN